MTQQQREQMHRELGQLKDAFHLVVERGFRFAGSLLDALLEGREADAARLRAADQPRPPRLWAVPEVAAYLGVEPRTIYQWVWERSMPSRKAGEELRFDPDEVDRWTVRDRAAKEPVERARAHVVQ